MMLEGLQNYNNSPESENVHKEHLIINGAEVDVVDVVPENQKDEVPVLVLPGWGATMESFMPGIKVLNDKERRVISLNHPRTGGDISSSYSEDIDEWYKKRGQDYPDWPIEELRKAHTILGLIDEKKLEKVDAIAHSEGAINLCIAAMLHPEKFTGRTLVLVNPAGLIGDDSIFRLQKGAGATTSRTETISEIPVTEAETEYLESTKHITPDYMKENPLRAAKEIWAISKARIEDMLRYLHEKGIRIIVIGAVDDTMFPMGTRQETKDEEGNTRFEFVGDKGMQKNVKADFVDGFLSVRGGHMQIQVHPELYMSAAEKMLTKPKEKPEEESDSTL
jgi:pimeloyl-ACP methyl ester carboxylesterase